MVKMINSRPTYGEIAAIKELRSSEADSLPGIAKCPCCGRTIYIKDKRTLWEPVAVGNEWQISARCEESHCMRCGTIVPYSNNHRVPGVCRSGILIKLPPPHIRQNLRIPEDYLDRGPVIRPKSLALFVAKLAAAPFLWGIAFYFLTIYAPQFNAPAWFPGVGALLIALLIFRRIRPIAGIAIVVLVGVIIFTPISHRAG
jgi:DNA-directed RNA polymerase subunit RPC12/RpoP